MATKPTVLNLWSTDAVYTVASGVSAPLLGTPTKIQYPSPKYDEGFIDNDPAFSQGDNFLYNEITTWLDWVKSGTFALQLDAHIIEADSAGTINIGSSFFGNNSSILHALEVRPNTGVPVPPEFMEGAIRCFASAAFNGGKFITHHENTRALIVESDAQGIASIAMVIDAGVDRGGGKGKGTALVVHGGDLLNLPVMVVDTIGPGMALKLTGGPSSDTEQGGEGLDVTGGAKVGNQFGNVAIRATVADPTRDGIVVDKTDIASFGTGLKITAANAASCIDATQSGGKTPTVVLAHTATGGDVSAPLQIVPQAELPSGTGFLFNGSIHVLNEVHDALQQYRPFIKLRNQSSLSYSRDPSCHALAKVAGPVSTSTVDSTPTDLISSFKFDNEDGIPMFTGIVELEFSGQVKRSSSGSDIVNYKIEVSDLTTPGVVGSFIVALNHSAAAIGGSILTNFYRLLEYTLPAAGQRSFKVTHEKEISTDAATCDVEDFTVRIQPKRRM